MSSFFRNNKGMNIVGQGGKIILFMLPSLLAALFVQGKWPEVAALPAGLSFLRLVGIIWLVPGLVLWGAAVIQLLSGFGKGKLITVGAYAVVRNPIYSSVALFVLPAVTMLTLTWVYLVPALFLYAGVLLFIRKEEKALLAAFGEEYSAYLRRVHRLVPFIKPVK